MKVCIIQPPYSTDYSKIDEYFDWQIDALAKCDESMDIIVLPESCDIPCLAKKREDFLAAVGKFRDRLIYAACETAKRCNSMVFFNASGEGFKNTTYAVNRQGEIVGKYDKVHPTASEIWGRGREAKYSFEFAEPYIVEIEGLRFAFLTCYDFYFYEIYANIARYNVDFVIGCSHQRSDTHEALETITKFLAYNTNSYVLRASVSMGEDSPLGGCSMIVAPTGKVLCNMHSEIGMRTVEIDPTEKYYKPAGFGNPPTAHYEYVEKGRRPWKYRQGGSGIVPYDKWMEYPRLCAHRGFNTVAPENSMPAYGAAIGMGAEEIEFDVWATSDGHLVSLHDAILDRVSNGWGAIWDRDLAYFKNCDFGSCYDEKYKGLKGATFEEILKRFAGRAIMNIHVKIWDMIRISTNKNIDPKLYEIAALIKKYDCEKHVYFMSTNTEMLCRMREILPDAGYCQGAGEGNEKMVEAAIENRFDKVQFVKDRPYSKELVDKCHENGIKCNMFWSDDPEEARGFLEMGIDCILTNDYQRVYDGVYDLLITKK